MSTTTTPTAVDERAVAAAALDSAEEQLQSLCVSHAGTFVAVERRARLLQTNLEQLLKDCDAVSKAIEICQPYLLQNTDEINTTTTDNNGNIFHTIIVNDGSNNNLLSSLSEKHRVRRRTLLQHSSLLELLELPNIMDACVRSSLYDEALQVASFANTLQRRHCKSTSTSTASNIINKSNDSIVVQQVIQQIRTRQVDLRKHLLHRLRGIVTMPECLEVVTAVRRLNAIDLELLSNDKQNIEKYHLFMEYQLQIDFLEARDIWLDSNNNNNNTVTNTTNTANTSGRPSLMQHSTVDDEPLLDAIERYRTRVFEVATQFNAIFRAQQQQQQNDNTSTTNDTTKLLALWTTRRIESFLNLLRKELLNSVTNNNNNNNIPDVAAIRDALEASIFFANSMGRLGADFTSQLSIIFEPLVLDSVTTHWKNGFIQLHETLTICRDAGVASPLTSDVIGSSNDDDNEHDINNHATSLELPQPAPKILLKYPPLARYVNSILTGLNELRRCLLPGIFPALRRCLEEQIQSVTSELLSNERTVLTPGFRGDVIELRTIANIIQVIFTNICEPYIRGSLEAAIGNTIAATQQHTILYNNMKKDKEEKQKEQQKQNEEEEEKNDEEELEDDEGKNDDDVEKSAEDVDNKDPTNDDDDDDTNKDDNKAAAADNEEVTTTTMVKEEVTKTSAEDEQLDSSSKVVEGSSDVTTGLSSLEEQHATEGEGNKIGDDDNVSKEE